MTRYLGDRKEVDPAFFSPQLIHEHGSTNQQEVCLPIFIHVN